MDGFSWCDASEGYDQRNEEEDDGELERVQNM
jgi:hypothetical protein